MPKVVIETGSNKFKRRWKRKEIGIRMPLDDITSEVLNGLDEPLLTGTLTHSLTYLLAHSLTHSLTLTPFLPPSLPPSLTHSLARSLTH